MIPYSRPKLSDFRTLSQTKQLENHTLHSGTYPYSVYMGVPPPPRGYFSIRDENTSISFKCTTSSVLVLECALYLRPPFYLEKAKAILLFPLVSFLQYL